mgnify:CR=1 FL=1
MAKPLIRGIRTFWVENTPRETPPQDLLMTISSFPAPFWGPIGAHRGLGPKSWPEIMKTKKIGQAVSSGLAVEMSRDLIREARKQHSIILEDWAETLENYEGPIGGPIGGPRP